VLDQALVCLFMDVRMIQGDMVEYNHPSVAQIICTKLGISGKVEELQHIASSCYSMAVIERSVLSTALVFLPYLTPARVRVAELNLYVGR